MKKDTQYYVDLVVNQWLLKPVGLRVARSVGSDPWDDMRRILAGHPVACVVDGGAYRGDFSIRAAIAFPGATVYAFEPTADSFGLLVNNTAGVSRIRPMRYALSEAAGRQMLYRNASPLTNSLSKNATAAGRYFAGPNAPEGTEVVEVETLEQFMRREMCQGIDVLKLDLQGHELKAMIGLGESIHRVELILSEVAFVSVYEDAPLFSEVESYLRGRGFAFYQFYELVRSPVDGRLLYGDALFVNRDLLPSDVGSHR